VAYKLASAMRSEAGVESDSGIDLVALATVADLVPLTGENRTLVKRGLNRMRTSPRIGLRALMEASRVSPDEVDAGALGFRLAPRINAAGRLYRADAGVELMLSDDPVRAAQIGEELNRANSERRSVEREVMNGAESVRREMSAEQLRAPALVLAGEDWHPGVVGIVASRLAEKYWRPVVLIALEDGIGRGSGRSIRGYDLLAGITAGGAYLNRFGGHKMAAGLEIDAARIDAFREAFTADAISHLGPEGPVRTTEVDAVIGAGRHGIDMELAEQLESLEPFGMGNPRPNFLVPAARFEAMRPMGRDGKHVSFNLRSGSGGVKGVGFGLASELESIGEAAADTEVQVEMHRWNDSVEARVVVREVAPLEASGEADYLDRVELDSTGWWERLARGLSSPFAAEGASGLVVSDGEGRVEVDRRDSPVIPAILDLASTGDSLLVVSCDAILRRGLITAADPARLGSGLPALAPGSASSKALESAAESGSVVFADWDAISIHPHCPAEFPQVAAIDPPWDEATLNLLRYQRTRGEGSGFIHLLWHTSDLAAAEASLRLRLDARATAVEIWRALDAAGGTLSGEDLESALRSGEPAVTRPPESTAIALRALEEANQIEVDLAVDQRSVSLLEGGGQLEASATFNESRERLASAGAVLAEMAQLAPENQVKAA
jgi:single-stranded-DNA-specific exonuclease